MTPRQSCRAPELVRRTVCCKREAWVANGRLWCPSCGQEVLTAAKVFRRFKDHPAPATSPAAIARPKGRRRGPIPGQGALL